MVLPCGAGATPWLVVAALRQRQRPHTQQRPPLSKLLFAAQNGLRSPHNHRQWCELATYGVGWGGHALCNLSSYLPPGAPCTLISGGIGIDSSFDSELAERHGCAGVGLDPTVPRPLPCAAEYAAAVLGVWDLYVSSTCPRLAEARQPHESRGPFPALEEHGRCVLHMLSARQPPALLFLKHLAARGATRSHKPCVTSAALA